MSALWGKMFGTGEGQRVSKHALPALVACVERGILTQAQVSAALGLDAADWAAIADVLSPVNQVTDPVRRVLCGADAWRLLLAAEVDDDNATGLQTEATFKAKVEALRDFYNGL